MLFCNLSGAMMKFMMNKPLECHRGMAKSMGSISLDQMMVLIWLANAFKRTGYLDSTTFTSEKLVAGYALTSPQKA